MCVYACACVCIYACVFVCLPVCLCFRVWLGHLVYDHHGMIHVISQQDLKKVFFKALHLEVEGGVEDEDGQE